jgi:hypothetical protein
MDSFSGNTPAVTALFATVFAAAADSIGSAIVATANITDGSIASETEPAAS